MAAFVTTVLGYTLVYVCWEGVVVRMGCRGRGRRLGGTRAGAKGVACCHIAGPRVYIVLNNPRQETDAKDT